jgi:hypothetical protein
MKTKNKKELNFVQKFNKMKETDEYKSRMRFWNSIKHLHNLGSIKLFFDKREHDFRQESYICTYSTSIWNNGRKLNTFIDFYNYLFPK